MKLESYIRNNRNALDVEKPDEEYLWKGIQQATGIGKKHRQIVFFRSAAAIAAIMILSVTLAYFIGQNQQPRLIFLNMDPDLAKQEVHLLNQINDYSDQIKKASFNSTQLVTGNRDIEYVDELINHYSEDLKQNGPNPKLINSLMDLYQKKILILNRMLNEIEKNKSHEKHKVNM
ncbi:MAG: hypothetical protein NTV31_08115 [Bacteroidia bacterium]|nr:hypothetical protein [Bacteroidia bacterium]